MQERYRFQCYQRLFQRKRRILSDTGRVKFGGSNKVPGTDNKCPGREEPKAAMYLERNERCSASLFRRGKQTTFRISPTKVQEITQMTRAIEDSLGKLIAFAKTSMKAMSIKPVPVERDRGSCFSGEKVFCIGIGGKIASVKKKLLFFESRRVKSALKTNLKKLTHCQKQRLKNFG